MSGLCKYCSVAGPNGRSRICSLGMANKQKKFRISTSRQHPPTSVVVVLGEDIMLSVLHMRARGLPTLKSKITEFLRIQIRVHHPGETLFLLFQGYVAFFFFFFLT